MAGKNYAAGIPMGNNQMPMNGSPAPFKAVKQYLNENATTSSVITLTQDTTAVEVAAGGTPVYMRWVYVTDASGPATSVIAVAGSTANFDHMIGPNAFRRFVVPIEVSNNGIQVGNTITSQVGANIENGLFRRLAVKTAGIASVAVTEYGSSNSY